VKAIFRDGVAESPRKRMSETARRGAVTLWHNLREFVVLFLRPSETRITKFELRVLCG
jgi:hypothetical protein